ncbi:MAG: aminoglycoside phosphotransferase family protein [Halobacteria archaeon]
MKLSSLRNYLQQQFGEKVEISYTGELKVEKDELKGFGYGKPVEIEIKINEDIHSLVLSSMRVQKGFGHDHFSDRAQILLWQYSTFNKLPRHVKALDVGYFTREGELFSAGGAEEFFLLMEKVQGREYHFDLDRLRDGGELRELDIARARALSNYLAQIHSQKHRDEELYKRRIRELVGHGECIMGLIDSYPRDFEFASPRDFCKIEQKCIEWRFKLRDRAERLSVVHGDFHPWNVIFREGIDFTILDRSRGEYGEPADDVATMSMNYLFYSLQKYGKLENEFKLLFDIFIGNYLEKTGDSEILKFMPPFYVFRALVIASPIWYPTLPPKVRMRLFSFIRNILEVEEFEPRRVNELLE